MALKTIYINLDNIFINDNILDFINKYYNSYDIKFLCSGTPEKINSNKKWLKDNIPYDVELIGIEDYNKNKSKLHIDMENSIQIDNDIFYLLDTNASMKILFKNKNNSNREVKNKNFMLVETWDEIDSIIQFYINYDYKTLEKNI